MNVLVLNSGSSSLKYQLINMQTERVLAKGICEGIGLENSSLRQVAYSGKEISKTEKISNHKKAFECAKNMLLDKECGVISSIDEITAVGHRVVHGGEYFEEPAVIGDKEIDQIKSLIPLAPLHNGANLSGILACREILGKNVVQVAVFDTSFYAHIPEKAYMFAIPYFYYEKYDIRKYGFHGTSHKYVSERCAKLMNKDISKLKLITCHLGSGSSITAINGGKAIDTSMGLTPLGGLMMGTRCGSIDPSVILTMAEKEKLSIAQINDILNKKSGILGVSGISSDDRIVLDAGKNGNKRAVLAHDMMIYQITQFIGAYMAVLGGCDALVFTGGVGENQWIHRKKVCDNFSFAGIKINDGINEKTIGGLEGEISCSNSNTKIFVIPTNEELEIARETLFFLKKVC